MSSYGPVDEDAPLPEGTDMDMTATGTGIILAFKDTLFLPHTSTHVLLPELDPVLAGYLEDDTSTLIAANIIEGRVGTEPDDLHRTAVTFRVRSHRQAENGHLLELVAGERIHLEQVAADGGQFRGRFTVIPDVQDLDEVTHKQVIDHFKTIVKETTSHLRDSDQFLDALERADSIETMIVWLSRYVPLSPDEKHAFLKMDSQRERILNFTDVLLRNREMIKWNIELGKRISGENDKQYRTQVLRAQLKAIQEELDEDGEGGEDDAVTYRRRIEETFLPDDVRKAALLEVKKLKGGSIHNPETGVARNYLDFILALPWEHSGFKDIDLAAAERILEEDHYGLAKVKKRIIEHLAVMQLRGKGKGSILLLVGPPGTGKTSLGKSIARALGREYVRLSLGGIRDESEIRGHRRTYIGAIPGRILNSMKRVGTTDPVMVLDEVDKLLPGGFSGDPASALLEVLDPEQNSTFTDHYLDLPYDLSDVFFIATANSTDTIAAPLLDRMEVIRISSYTEDEKYHIATGHLVSEVLEDAGLDRSMLIIGDEVIRTIIADYTREGGVRGLKKALMTIARNVAAEIVKHETDLPRVVTADELDELLGRKIPSHDLLPEDNPPGVVTGLAWTPNGGEILFIEAVDMPGSGKVTLTGQLGDVMQESAQLSLSLLRSRLPLETGGLSERDVHVHVPSGATPKDGPSAGITIFTALASLSTGIPVDPHLAMTGEITLRGAVMSIGGVKEKLLAAQRVGVRRVLVPVDNVPDLKDLPSGFEDDVEVIPVETVEDVLRESIGIELPRAERFLYPQ